MKKNQGKHVVGYTKVKVRGKQPELFFQYCINHNIKVWSIEKTKNNVCIGSVYWNDIDKLERLRENLPYEFRITRPKGLFPSLLRMWSKKEIILSILLCAILIFVLSNIVWNLEITGVTKEVDKKIRSQLTKQGLYEGAWAYNLDTLDDLQQQLLHEVPELLYIGIYKNGTTYHVDAIEKLEEKETPSPPIQDLVADKSGVVQKLFIKNGIAKVAVNDVVEKGDVLVSGTIALDENEENPKEEKVAAEGKVYANTWYEMDISSSLYSIQEKLTGEKRNKYALQFKNIEIPIWGFKSVPFTDQFKEIEKKELLLFKYKLPITLIKKTIYDKNTIKTKRTKEEAREIALSRIKDHIHLNLGSDAKILKYKVLHETVENGKVKMNLYISVLENIAEGKDMK